MYLASLENEKKTLLSILLSGCLCVYECVCGAFVYKTELEYTVHICSPQISPAQLIAPLFPFPFWNFLHCRLQRAVSLFFLAFDWSNLQQCTQCIIMPTQHNPPAVKQTMGPELVFPGQAPQHPNITTREDILLLCSSKELTLNCSSHSCPASLHFSHFLPSFLWHIGHLWSEPGWGEKTKRQQSSSIKPYFSNGLGRSFGHLGLITGWRMRISEEGKWSTGPVHIMLSHISLF